MEDALGGPPHPTLPPSTASGAPPATPPSPDPPEAPCLHRTAPGTAQFQTRGCRAGKRAPGWAGARAQPCLRTQVRLVGLGPARGTQRRLPGCYHAALRQGQLPGPPRQGLATAWLGFASGAVLPAHLNRYFQVSRSVQCRSRRDSCGKRCRTCAAIRAANEVRPAGGGTSAAPTQGQQPQWRAVRRRLTPICAGLALKQGTRAPWQGREGSADEQRGVPPHTRARAPPAPAWRTRSRRTAGWM